ncbi:MAG: hypothetical protein GF414_00540 [Candidatus Altiarchaeales archaeon]|nr:hypothetical protein [Candidatus Altiarchaeales archaeon]
MVTMVKRILSVDFDYFYPDSAPYDWGHSENYSPVLANMLWHARAGNVNLMTGDDALESYRPSVPTNFWSRVLKNKPRAYIADSHVEIWDLFEDQPGSSNVVVSYDAHHDCGYGIKTPEDALKISSVDCGSWGLMGKVTGRIRSLQLYYPAWRKKAPETLSEVHGIFDVPAQTKYALPAKPEAFDLVFICRSGAWTPPWYDEEFFKFVESSGLEYEAMDEVEEPRSPDMVQAKHLAKEYRKMVANFRSNKEGSNGTVARDSKKG